MDCILCLAKICGKTSLPRAKPAEVAEQSWAKPGEFRPGTDENGNPIRIFHGPIRYHNLKTVKPVKGDVHKQNDLVVHAGASTLYDLIMGSADYDKLKCLGHITKPHAFKDAEINGKPNLKPVVLKKAGEWSFRSYRETRQEASKFGAYLREKCGIEPQEKIAIWSGNRPEWMLAELACHAFSWTSVSVYDTLGPNAASFIVADSGAAVLVVEGKTFDKVPEMIKHESYANNSGKALELVVTMDEPSAKTLALLENLGVKVITFSDAVKESPENHMKLHTPPLPNTLGTIMYTSGTTGNPKGVKLTHQNLVSTVSALQLMPGVQVTCKDVHLSYLPLAHIFERQIQYAVLGAGAEVYYASNGAKALLPDLSTVRPTVFIGVPKVYENVRDGVVRKMTGFKEQLLKKALEDKIADIETGCGYPRLWDKLVFSKTKKALGGRVRMAVSGGAPISKDTLQFALCALGPVTQGYGATETTAGATVAALADLEIGHVGPPTPNCAVRLVDVPEMNYFAGEPQDYEEGSPGKKAFDAGKFKRGGEVWVLGFNISPGYYDPSKDGKKPDVESNGMVKKTEEDFFVDNGLPGFKTGDIGMWTDRFTLKIVDRRKNMFKTSLGEYVPVEEVEKTYQDGCKYVDFVFLPKETKVSYIALCCVVSDSVRTVMTWAKTVPELDGMEVADVVQSKQFKDFLLQDFKRLGKAKKLLSFLQVQKVENIHVEALPIGYQESWVEGVQCSNGHVEQLLTATFKARRTQLDQYYAPVFKSIYPDRPADHILP